MENVKETKNFLEEKYGIKEGSKYFIEYGDENGNNVVEIFKKVEILNFHPTQLIGRNEDGMIILKPRNIIYMHTHKEIK